MSDQNNCKTRCQQSETDAMSRRTVLRGAVITAGGAALLTGMATTQPAEAKMTAAAAAYQTSAKDGKTCSTCSLFEAPASCRLVDGTISPNGYCRFYVKKS